MSAPDDRSHVPGAAIGFGLGARNSTLANCIGHRSPAIEMVGAGPPKAVYLGIKGLQQTHPRRDAIMYTMQGAMVGGCASCPHW